MSGAAPSQDAANCRAPTETPRLADADRDRVLSSADAHCAVDLNHFREPEPLDCKASLML